MIFGTKVISISMGAMFALSATHARAFDDTQMTRKFEREFQKERQEETERQQEAIQNDCCPICLDPLENQAQCTSPCGHTFCSPCFVKNISLELSRGHTARCAYCRTTTIELTYQGSN